MTCAEYVTFNMLDVGNGIQDSMLSVCVCVHANFHFLNKNNITCGNSVCGWHFTATPFGGHSYAHSTYIPMDGIYLYDLQNTLKCLLPFKQKTEQNLYLYIYAIARNT